jgi:hypothetical protein
VKGKPWLARPFLRGTAVTSRNAGWRGLLGSRLVHGLALLGLCAAYIQGGLNKLMEWPGAVAETAHFGVPMPSLAAAATIATGFCQHSRPIGWPLMQNESRLRGFQNCERSRSTTEMQQAATAGRDRLIVVGAGAEEVAEFVVAFAEALG